MSAAALVRVVTLFELPTRRVPDPSERVVCPTRHCLVIAVATALNLDSTLTQHHNTKATTPLTVASHGAFWQVKISGLIRTGLSALPNSSFAGPTRRRTSPDRGYFTACPGLCPGLSPPACQPCPLPCAVAALEPGGRKLCRMQDLAPKAPPTSAHVQTHCRDDYTIPRGFRRQDSQPEPGN